MTIATATPIADMSQEDLAELAQVYRQFHQGDAVTPESVEAAIAAYEAAIRKEPLTEVKKLIKLLNTPMYFSAFYHPHNYMGYSVEEIIDLDLGVRAACSLVHYLKEPFLFHESSIERLKQSIL
jgi:hypothetical protein